MKKHKSILLASIIFTSIFSLGFVFPEQTTAAPPGCYVELPNGSYSQRECNDGQRKQVEDRNACFIGSTERNCDSIRTDATQTGNFGAGDESTIPVEDTSIDTDCNETPLTAENCGIIGLIVAGINFLSALAVLAIIASIVIAGYQYMTAQDNTGKIQQAKQRIIWALVALALLIFMYTLLNWLVPGGVL